MDDLPCELPDLEEIEAEITYLILVEMMKEAWAELRKEQPKLFGQFDCY
jgi:hypothetical protein